MRIVYAVLFEIVAVISGPRDRYGLAIGIENIVNLRRCVDGLLYCGHPGLLLGLVALDAQFSPDLDEVTGDSQSVEVLRNLIHAKTLGDAAEINVDIGCLQQRQILSV